MQFNTTEQKSLYPDETFDYREAVPSALIANPLVTTVAGMIEGDKPQVRVPFIKTDPTSGFVKEGAVINNGGGELDEVLITTGKIATIVTQSNESASFQTASQLIAAGVSRSIITSADQAFLNNPKATDPAEQNGPVGILNATGITTLSTNADKIVDAIADAKAGIGTNGGTPSAIIVNYATEAILRKLALNSGEKVLGSPSQAGQLTVFDLPVIVNNAMPDSQLFLTSAFEIVAAVGPVQLATSGDALFNSDSLVRRATWRIGAKAIHPDRLALLTITSE
jgi:HK97 family phage major capsid protein